MTKNLNPVKISSTLITILNIMKIWHPGSWQLMPCEQLPTYHNKKTLHAVMKALQMAPPLINAIDVDTLIKDIADAQQGKKFILQAGACAEIFADCHEQAIHSQLAIILKMSHILQKNLQKPIINIGRIAGQYAKPRSQLTEKRNNIVLPNYRGDIINDATFTTEAREANPHRMQMGYESAKKTLAHLQTLISNSAFYTSHEALLLYYEEALTRFDHKTQRWYNLATHFPWLGMRSAKMNTGHLEYLRGIANPIAIKLGPEMTPALLVNILNALNPCNLPGKITLIHRMGVKEIKHYLPPLFIAVKKAAHQVLWLCDPMHGNTQFTTQGIKTRHFDDIAAELNMACTLHEQYETYLGGLHLEVSGEKVTECIGGEAGILADELTVSYKSLVDPRLNYHQALEIAGLLTNKPCLV